MALKHRTVDYSNSIGDLMSGLAIFFILLFICLIIVQRNNIAKANTIIEKNLAIDKYQGRINNFITSPQLYLDCPIAKGEKNLSLKSLDHGHVGVFIQAQELFHINSGKFKNPNYEKQLKCLLTKFLKVVILNPENIKERDLEYVNIESKGDFYLNAYERDSSELYLNKNDAYLKQMVTTIDRTRSVFQLLFKGETPFSPKEMIYLNSHLAGGGLAWSQHLKQMTEDEDKIIENESPNERSIQVRLIFRDQQ